MLVLTLMMLKKHWRVTKSTLKINTKTLLRRLKKKPNKNKKESRRKLLSLRNLC